MARKRDRVIAITLAVVFFVVSSATSFYFIYELYKDNKEAKTVNQQDSSATSGSDQQKKVLQGSNLENFTPNGDISELKAEDTTPGTGTEAKAGDTVVVDYTGAVASTGVIFQSSLDNGQPASLSLNQVIQGWKDGIPGMKVGGTRRLYIPAAQAYGANPPQGSNIPANAALVFDVTLHSVAGSEQ